MKNILSKAILLISILIVNLFYTQQFRFYYELSYKACLTCEDISKEIDVLSITQSASVFQSYDQLQKDSIFIDPYDKQRNFGTEVNIDNIMAQNLNHTYIISKNYKSKEVYYKDIIGNQDSFKYLENEKLVWELVPSKDTINGYLCQKATTSFGGRIWNAWFTTDVQFQDGPYKFWGLPGLIVKIGDVDSNYVWNLIGNKTIKSENAYENNIMEYQGFQSIDLSKDKFVETIKQYQKNPLGNLRSRIGVMDPHAEKQLREQEKLLLKDNEKKNNSIEIY